MLTGTESGALQTHSREQSVPLLANRSRRSCRSQFAHGLAIGADLFKVRLNSLVLFTTLTGYYMGAAGHSSYRRLLHTLAGTALVAAGSAALNQFLERDSDAKMPRTRRRPLPAQHITPAFAVLAGSGAVVAGLIELQWAVNTRSCLVAAITALIYLFIYTPMKRRTWLNTFFGAIAGATPPVIGWAAAQGRVAEGAFALFAIQALWQLPHFMAICWLYRDDYRAGGFRMISTVDETSARTAQVSLWSTFLLAAASLTPLILRMVSPLYLAAVLPIDIAFIAAALHFCKYRSDAAARRLFLMSLAYLPTILLALVANKANS